MIPLWFTNPGEDFKIEKYPENMLIVTADKIEIKLRSMVSQKIPVIGRDADVIYAVFCGRRLAFTKVQAMQISGNISGLTKIPPEIRTAPNSCCHDCAHCKHCC